jgi:hypothetical protein
VNQAQTKASLEFGPFHFPLNYQDQALDFPGHFPGNYSGDFPGDFPGRGVRFAAEGRHKSIGHG